MSRLTEFDHRRDLAGLTYVYPVLSRRAGGLSIGINLNPNHACNWRCIYCQVPNLRRGNAPPIDTEVLAQELEILLTEVLEGDFYDRYQVPPQRRLLRDIAISGDGEPTTAQDFDRIVETIGEVAARFRLTGRIGFVLITNGSRIERPSVQRALRRWAEWGGEVWFKVDRATTEGIGRTNQVHLAPETVRRRLSACAGVCPTWIQTCWFALDDRAPSESEGMAYLDFVGGLVGDGVPLRGVLLYGIARPSCQPEAPRLSRLAPAELEAFAERIRERGLIVRSTP
ncbi:MAG TPA: radical SAM protein [Methylococcus sp.]|nr:radical SAM protein [Methylococcus sp.]